MNIYLVKNDKGRISPSCEDIQYIHVKCKSDGSSTLIVTMQVVESADLVMMSSSDAQTILDQWISEENSVAGNDDQGVPLIQGNINLDLYLV